MVVGALAVVAAGLGWLAAQIVLSRATVPPDVPGLLWPNPKQLTPFSLHDQRGQAFDLDRLQRRWTFIFFGYTHCPDVCPLTLASLKDVDRWLVERGAPTEDVQYVFISVDPERDTPGRLGEYVAHFDQGFLGVTGSDEELGALTRQLGVIYIRGDPDERGEYSVDHTASLFLVDPQARLIAAFPAPHDAATIAEQLTAIRNFLGG